MVKNKSTSHHVACGFCFVLGKHGVLPVVLPVRFPKGPSRFSDGMASASGVVAQIFLLRSPCGDRSRGENGLVV